jgi:purine nucleosidase
MARKLILDSDPGIDDAVAISLALADPRLEVLAVTAVGGNVGAEQTTRNVQTIVEQLDPPRWPRLGAATCERMMRVDARHVFGADGLCGAEFPVAELHHQRPSVKVLCDEIRTSPSEITVVATGPLSNIAAALQQQPDLASVIGHLIIMGGTLSGPGNITASAEFNIYCDAEAARDVFRSPVTKTLIPLDVTSQVLFGFETLEQIPGNSSRTGRLLGRIMPGAFRAYRQQLGVEGIYLHDAIAVVLATDPELFTTEPMHGDVETDGTLTHGATVFDRRRHPESRPNMDVVTGLDAGAVKDRIFRVLGEGA